MMGYGPHWGMMSYGPKWGMMRGLGGQYGQRHLA